MPMESGDSDHLAPRPSKCREDFNILEGTPLR